MLADIEIEQGFHQHSANSFHMGFTHNQGTPDILVADNGDPFAAGIGEGTSLYSVFGIIAGIIESVGNAAMSHMAGFHPG